MTATARERARELILSITADALENGTALALSRATPILASALTAAERAGWHACRERAADLVEAQIGHDRNDFESGWNQACDGCANAIRALEPPEDMK